MQKRFTYNRETRDFDMYADGEYIGSVPTAADAIRELDQYALDVARDLSVALRDEAAERRELEVA